MKSFSLIIVFLLCLIFGAVCFDNSELSHKVDVFRLADKWHETSCFPLYDGNGNYMGESCSDEWELVVIGSKGRESIPVSGNIFKDFLAGDTLRREYDKGRLGIRHNESWIKIA